MPSFSPDLFFAPCPSPPPLQHISRLSIKRNFRPPALAERDKKLVTKTGESEGIEDLHQGTAKQDLPIGAGEIDQETQAAIAHDIEFKEIARTWELIAQTPDDNEQRQVQDEFVKGRGLAAHSMLHDSPGQVAGQTERVAAQQVAEPPDRLRQRQGWREEGASGVVDVGEAFNEQDTQIATKKAAGPCLSAVPERGQVFDEGGWPQEDQHAQFGSKQPAR